MLVLAVVPALIAGFIVGVYAYAHVHGHFFGKVEESVKRRVAIALAAEREKRGKVEEVRKRLVDQWGPDLSEKHQEVISEEVERVLSAGPRRK